MRNVCQVLSSGEHGPGAAAELDAVPLTRGILLERKWRSHSREREEPWTVCPQTGNAAPPPPTRELCSVDILDGSLFQGSGSCKDIWSLLSHLLVEAGKFSISVLIRPEKV